MRTFFVVILLACFVGFVGCTDQQVENLQQNTSLNSQVTALKQDTAKFASDARHFRDLFDSNETRINELHEQQKQTKEWFFGHTAPEDMLIWVVDSNLVEAQISYLCYLGSEVYESARPVWSKWFIDKMFLNIDRYTPFSRGEALIMANQIFAQKKLLTAIWTSVKPVVVPLVRVSGERDLVLRKAQEFRRDIAWTSPALARVDSVRQAMINGITVPEDGEGSGFDKTALRDWFKFYNHFDWEFKQTCHKVGISENDIDFATLRYRWQIKVANAGGNFNSWHREVLRIIDDFIGAIR